MVTFNPGQSGNQAQLESLDSLRSAAANNSNALPSLESLRAAATANNSNGLQSLDSIRANNYTNPNLAIPANNDILAPIEVLNPVVPESSREDTKEHGALEHLTGVVKGFGLAGRDTVVGLVTLATVVGGGIAHPSKTLSWVGGGLKYAVTHPIGAVKTVAYDLPKGIIRGITQPYSEAIHKGQYGQVLGRGIFDVGIVLLTAGLGGESETASKTAATTEAVKKGAKGAKVIEEATQVAGGATEGVNIVQTGINGPVTIAKDAIKVTAGKGAKVVNNIYIGTVTSDVSVTAGGGLTKGAKAVTGASEAITVAKASSRISLGLGDLTKAIGRGISNIGNLFSPLGAEIGTGLNTIVGESAATAIKNTTSAITRNLGAAGTAMKNGAIFVKAHPLATGLIAGKATDIIDKGLQASDHYNPDN